MTAKRLFIIDTPIAKIADHTFYGINDTLKEIHLINTKLSEFPTDAFKVSENKKNQAYVLSYNFKDIEDFTLRLDIFKKYYPIHF